MKFISFVLLACFICTFSCTPTNSSHLSKRDLRSDFISFGFGNLAFITAGKVQYTISDSMSRTLSAFLTTENVALQSILQAGSIAANIGMSLVLGMGVGFAIGFISSLIGGNRKGPSSYDIYLKIKGYIQNQIGETLAVVGQSQSLGEINDTMTRINTHLQTLGDLNPCMHEESMITVLTQLLNEFQIPNQAWLPRPGLSDTFLLCSPVGHPSTYCLHTSNSMVDDNTELMVDDGVNINSIPINAMAFSTRNGNLQLVQPNGAVHNLDFNPDSNNADIVVKANYEIANSCSLNQNPDGTYSISLTTDGTKSLFETGRFELTLPVNNQICLWNGDVFTERHQTPVNGLIRKREGNPNYLVSWDYYNVMKNHINSVEGFITEYPQCQEGGLNFANKLTIPTNVEGQYMTFAQIGMQVMSMPFLASVHLSTLFELYHRDTGSQEAYIRNFDSSIQIYKDFLDYYVPIFSTYASVLGKDFSQIITMANNMRAALNNATLEFSQPITFQISNAVEVVKNIDPKDVCAGPILSSTTTAAPVAQNTTAPNASNIKERSINGKTRRRRR